MSFSSTFRTNWRYDSSRSSQARGTHKNASKLRKRGPQADPRSNILRGDFKMRRILISVIALSCFSLTVKSAFAQANNAAIGGVVADATKALIPGVTITLTNTATGVVETRLTN